jgi:hypothetical protein
MQFIERANKFFGRIKIKEAGNQVRITGIDGTIMRQHLSRVFETDQIAKLMFTSITDTSITLNSFFIPDFIYMLEVFKENPKCRWGAKRTVDKIIQGIMKNTWYKITMQPFKPMVDLKKMDRLKWKPLQKQIDFLSTYGHVLPKYDLRGFIIAMMPGLGKTFADLLLATCIIPDSVAEVKIIISPKKALHLVWEKTINEVFKKPVTSWVCDSGIKMPLDKTEYYVFNFEALDKAIELGRHLLSKGVRYFTIVDESHNFADYRSNRTQKLVQLQTLRDDLYFIWTSGSPILKSAAELTSFLKCSDPRYDDDADRRFKRIFTAAPGRANQIFNHRLGQMMAFLATKERPDDEKPIIKELPVKLPPQIAHRFLISTVREEMKEFIKKRLEFYKENIKEYQIIVSKGMTYHESKLKTRGERRAFAEYQQNVKIISRAPDLMLSDLMASTRTYERTKLFPSLPSTERRPFRNALSATKNVKLKVRGEALGTVLSKRRSECAAMLGLYCKPEEIMKESLSKTLFFASSILPIQMLEKKLTGMGFEPMSVYADTNSQLTQIINRFDNDPNANPICATMQSLSEAVPVTSASTVVLLNRPYRHAQWEQVVARADRNGQKYRVTVIEVTLDTGDEPNVSSTTDAILSNVRELINDIVGSEFAGPDPSQRQIQEVIDASKQDPNISILDQKLNL